MSLQIFLFFKTVSGLILLMIWHILAYVANVDYVHVGATTLK